MMFINFTKMHGLGNDYIIINCIENYFSINKRKFESITRYLCNRHFGIGADGVILVRKSQIADLKMSIYNSDGSEAKMCGNGIRCFAKYIYDKKLINKKIINIETLSGIKTAYIIQSKINSSIQEIKINMGKPVFEKEKIPVIINQSNNKLVELNLNILDKKIHAYCLSMGNPHTIIFCNSVENIPIKEYGSLIEKDSHFPDRTNVEFIQVFGSTSIKMRVWERGVGETYACGTGACAVSVVCNELGLTKKNVTVYLKGGELKVDLDKNVYMTGIATKVFDGIISINL